MKEEKDIAVIGMAGMFPMAKDIEEFWENLKQGKDCICDAPDTRIEDYISFFGEKVKKLSRLGYLGSINRFDAQFFGIAPGEAPFIDPAQRLLLEVVYSALEYGGYGGNRLANTRTGVFIAGSGSRYSDLIRQADFSMGVEVGNLPAVSAGRISHFFDLRGPSLLIDTACSSSLAALHYACESIKRGECSLAVVGAVNIYAYFDDRGADIDTQSKRGKVFDNSANGLVNGEGVSALLLKPLSQALADEDIICAVIKGTAVSHNGARTATISGQKPESLAEVVIQALENARINPGTISYIEASGAGTQMGDPIEIKAISDAFSKYTAKKEFCSIGCLKANIGHLGHTSGMASIIKVILALQNKQIPPLANFEEPNSYIDFKNSPVYIDEQLKDWELGEGENKTRRAGVSSFSVNGTNCHIILEEAPPLPLHPGVYPDRCNIVTLSAKNPVSLKRLCCDLKENMKKNSDYAFDDICFSMNTGRGQYNCRMAAVCETGAELVKILDDFDMTANTGDSNVFYHCKDGAVPLKSKAVFLFPGVEKDLEKLARDFYSKKFTAVKYMDECGNLVDLEKYPSALGFAFQYALAKLWMDAGIKPAVVLGFGTGKYVSKVIQGKLKPAEALEMCIHENIEKSSFNKDKFKLTIQQLYSKGQMLFLEIGPGSVLGTMTREVLQGKPGLQVIHSYGWEDKEKTLLKNIAAIYVRGTAIDFSSIFHARRVVLPTYPYNRKRYWIKNPDYQRLGISSGKPPQAVSIPGESFDVSLDGFSPEHIRQTLNRIWRDFFGIEHIEMDDDFFELGGDSLKTMTIISIIHKELKVKIPLTEFFSSPTVGQLAQYIHKAGSGEYSSIQPVEKKEYYPLSSAQRRLYILQEMVPASTAYNISQAVILEGESIKEKFAETFRKLINRHESFKTSLETIEQEPMQRIHDDAEFEIENYQDNIEAEVKVEEERFEGTRGLAPLSREPTERKAQNAGRKDGRCAPWAVRNASTIKNFIRPFDLSRAPLLRVGLLKTGEGRYLLMVDMHHIISDGVSQGILIQDFMALYKAEELPGLRIQYKDFSGWQNSGKEKENIKQQEKYWMKEFEGELPVLDLPIDYPRPQIQDFQGSMVRFGIGREETEALKMLASQEKTTLYMVLISVFNVLLYKLSGQEDIIIGGATAGRVHADLQKIIGMFLNMLALRNFPRAGKTFTAFLQEVTARVLQAFENQDYQFEDLVDQLQVKRDTGRNPLFDVMFILQTQGESEMAIPGLKLKPFDLQDNTSKFDLTLDGIEVNQELIFNVNFSTILFKRSTVELFLEHFKNIVSSVLQNPAKKLAEINIISEEKRAILLSLLNKELENEVKELMADSLFQTRLNESLSRFHHHAAIEYGDRTMSFGELDRESDIIANWLLKQGIERQTFIGILSNDRMEVIFTMIGILKIGCVVVPFYPGYPDERLENMIRSTHLKYIFIDTANARRFNGLEAQSKENKEFEFIFASQVCSKEEYLKWDKTPTVFNSPEDKLYIHFTSGTTGKPKAIVGKNKSLLHFINWEIETFNVTEEYRAAQFTIPGFDPFLRDVFVPLFCGGVVCIPANEEILLNAKELADWTDTRQIGLIHCVSGLFRVLTSDTLSTGMFRSLRYIMLAGEKITPADLVDWYKTFGQLIQLANCYGPTETTMSKICYMIREPDVHRQRIPIGKPIKGARVIILDKNLQVCDALEPGEICIRTPFRSFGYYNDPLLTNQKFIPNPFSHDPEDVLYRSGDLGRLLLDGTIDIMGRVDRQVKIRGHRIEPEEIETLLMTLPSVKEAAVVKKEIANHNELLCAYIVENPGNVENKSSISNLTTYLSKKLPDFMVPSNIMKIKKLPRNPNGKVDYDRLPDPLTGRQKDYVPPRDETEKNLLSLWSELLGIETTKISVTGNFFELGGSSLNVMTLIARIHRIFDIRISLGEIFTGSTIEKQAGIIKQAKKDKYNIIEALEKKDFYFLSSAQKRLYLLQQLDIESTAYNIPKVFVQEGKLVKKKFEEVSRKLIRRHESFRTSFQVIEDEPIQRIHDTVDFKIEYYDLKRTQVEVKDSDEEGTGGLAPLPIEPAASTIKNFIRPFDLTCAPLLRMGLIKAGEDRYILVVDMHHIIYDGTSMDILVKETMALYAENELSPLRIQYKDFSAWQNKLLYSGEIKKQEEYWLKQFEGEIPQLNLPVDFAGPAIQSFEGNTIGFEIGIEETDALKNIALEEGGTLFMILLSVYNIFLSKICNQQDIVVGIPTAGRRHADLEQIIGMFVNTLALRNFPNPQLTFRRFLADVKYRTLDAFENQDYQVELLVEQVAGKRKASRNPLFDVMFTLQNIGTQGEGVEIKGLNLKPYKYENKIAKFDVQLMCYESHEKLYFEFEYCTKRFKKESIEGFIRYFKAIVSSVIDDPGKTLSGIQMVPEKERIAIQFQFNEDLENE